MASCKALRDNTKKKYLSTPSRGIVRRHTRITTASQYSCSTPDVYLNVIVLGEGISFPFHYHACPGVVLYILLLLYSVIVYMPLYATHRVPIPSKWVL